MALNDKIIIECRCNEYNMRDKNPNVPWTADEILDTAMRVRDLGVSILHYHARTIDGLPNNSPEAYAEVIAKVREKTDLLLLPTLGFNSNDKEKDRIAMVAKISQNPLTKPDIVAIDTGSVNLDMIDPETGKFVDTESIYSNPTDVLIHCCEELNKLGIKIKTTCWDIGFVRRAVQLQKLGYISTPGYFLFHLTEGKYITGHQCNKAGIDALRSAVPEGNFWTVNCLGGNLVNMAPYIIEQGGNLACGIGDYHYAELGAPTNADIVKKVVAMAKAAGRTPATPEEVKSMFRMK